MNLSNGFYQYVDSQPTATALLLGEHSLTYSELAARVASCQQRLHRYLSDCTGVCSSNCRIAWDGPNSTALAVLYLACLREGHILVLFDPTWPSILREAAVARVNPALVVGPEHALFARDSGCLQECPQECTCNQRNFLVTQAEALAFLIGFTSGSSGTPKPFIRAQSSWLQTFAHAAKEFSCKPGCSVLAPGPLSHGLSFYAMAETLHNGGRFIALPDFDVRAVTAILQDQPIHTLVVVPTMLAALLDYLQGNSAALVTPSRILSAGAKLSTKLRKAVSTQFPDAELIEYYGASELSFVTVSHASEMPPPESVGRAFEGVELRVINAEGIPATCGQSGVVWVRSQLLAEGYLEADGTVSPLTLDGWATVGDIGWLDSNGYLSLVDRASNMLISGGLNVYPADVERVLEQLEAVSEAIVVGVPDDYWGDRVCALLRCRSTVSARVLRAHCREQLAPPQRPARFYRVSCWPLTYSGKIDRQALLRLLTTENETNVDGLTLTELHDAQHDA